MSPRGHERALSSRAHPHASEGRKPQHLLPLGQDRGCIDRLETMRLRSRAPLGRAVKPRSITTRPEACHPVVHARWRATRARLFRLAPRRPIEDASAPVELDRRARQPFDHPFRAVETRSADSMQPTFQRRAPLLHEATDSLDESEPASQTGEPRRFNGARPASAGWSCRRARMFSIRAFALRADL